VEALFAGAPFSTLPLEIFVAEQDGILLGFIEIGLRSHADGCDGRKPVGYIEGWYVGTEHRQLRVGRALFEAAENWARRQGCVEIASDTWIDNLPAQKAHEALGFKVVDRCVNYRKLL
jgi:aminoglycoside 6'-N-acetyltransferase I